MKNQFKLVFIFLFFISFSGFMFIANATPTTIGVEIGDEWTLEVLEVDETKLNQADANWKMNIEDHVYHQASSNNEMTKLGAKFKFRVDGITEETIGDVERYVIALSVWDWSVSEWIYSPYDTVWRVPKEPADNTWTHDVLFVGIPVSTYLSETGVVSLYDNTTFSVSGNTVSITPWGEAVDIKYEYTYDTTSGNWYEMSMIHSNEEIYKIGLSTGDSNGDTNGDGNGDTNGEEDEGTSIPGYEFITLFSIIGISIMGIIYNHIRKNHIN